MSILLALAAIPGMLGTQEAIRQGQQKERREEHRARRCNILASCIKNSARALEINGRPIILRDGAIYVDTCTENVASSGHRYTGYYLPYPDSQYEGLVTTITDEAPILNWVYIDARSCQLRYGTRKEAQPNFTGPFDCTRQDRRLTFQGWEGFCAVETEPGVWGVFFDIEDDGLQGRVRAGTLPAGSRVLEIELQRVENRYKKDPETRKVDQTTNREKKLDTNDKEIIVEPSALTSNFKAATNPRITGNSGDSSRSTARELEKVSEATPSSIPLTPPEATSLPPVPWPGTAPRTTQAVIAHNISPTKKGSNIVKSPNFRLDPPLPQVHPPKARRDSVSQNSSSEAPKAHPSEETDRPLMNDSSSYSPTSVHAKAPVILSTNQPRPQRHGRSRPPQASQRYINVSESKPRTDEGKPSENENTTSIEFSEPNLVTLNGSSASDTLSEKRPESRARSLFKRLGKGVSVRRNEDASRETSKFRVKRAAEPSVNAKTVLAEDEDQRGSRGRTKEQHVMMPHDSHQEDNDNHNSTVSRFRRSLSVVRSPSIWGTGNEKRPELEKRYKSWK